MNKNINNQIKKDMKTYIEISQPSTGKIFTNQVVSLVSFIQAAWSKKLVLSKKNSIALALLLCVCIALYLGCTLFSLIMVSLFFISLGVLINELVGYIRFIRDLE